MIIGHVVLFVVALVLVWRSADYVVDASRAMAHYWQLPPYIVGATVVAFGTSAPELFVSGFAAYDGLSGVVYGNILGSNMANMALILGVSLVLGPIRFTPVMVRELWVNMAIMGLFLGAVWWVDNRFWIAGLLGLLGFMGYQWYQLRGQNRDAIVDDTPIRFSGRQAVGVFVVALGVLIGSAQLLVKEVLVLGELLGVSAGFVSLFAVALGTSLPELVTSVQCMRKHVPDIVVGNVMGSNIFNVFGIIPVAWLIGDLPFPSAFFTEIGILIGVIAALLVMASCVKKTPFWLGYALIGLYVVYIGYRYMYQA